MSPVVLDKIRKAEDVRIVEENGSFSIQVKKDDVCVNVDNGTLSLSGVRRFDNKGVSNWEEFSDVEYARSFSVPQSIDVERVKAELKDGVLKLHLPKSEAAKPKMIEIKAA